MVQIPTGRRDGKVSDASNVRPNIVDTSFTMDEMVKLFSSKGLSLDDLVILSGTLIILQLILSFQQNIIHENYIKHLVWTQPPEAFSLISLSTYI